MRFERAAGIILHPTSLPGKFGIGDLGQNAYSFIDFMAESGQTLWQVFPLGPTGYGDSPYQSFSAFAGNPMLISPELLQKEGLLEEKDLEDIPEFDETNIQYGEVIEYKNKLLALAYENYKKQGKDFDSECGKFCENNKHWLDDFAVFMAVKWYHKGIVWSDWPKDIALRKGNAVQEWAEKLSDDVKYEKFKQYHFYKQWQNVKKYANDKGIKVIGDLPIFIAYDSSDLWSHKSLFSVNEKTGKLETVAGVPPDYFSETGQLWGNPLYRWKKMEKQGFQWWKDRMRKMFDLADIVRIDHFRGFDAYWEVPGDAETAMNGRWVKAPGEKLFNALKDEFGSVPIIAEDLGVITQSVADLRDKFEFPGIKIMQFAFGEGGDKKFLPHNYPNNCVVHSGSHDNDTTRGFFENEKEQNSGIEEWARKYLNYWGDDLRYEVIRSAYQSVADTVVIPMQDVLNLGTEARMNFPGKPAGNWTWRFRWDQINDGIKNMLLDMCKFYQRGEFQEEQQYEEIETEEE